MKETLFGFGKIIDPDKWDLKVWYRAISTSFPRVDG